MKLQFKFKTKDEIPQTLQPFYAERDGAWLLDVDGAVDRSRLEELVRNNATLLHERDELKNRFAGIDPDQVHSLAEEKRRLEEAQQLKAGEIEKVFDGRLKNLRTDFEKQISTLTTERDGLSSRLTSIQIDQGVIAAATQRGLRPTALPDITARARLTFKLSQGVPTAFESDGRTVKLGKSGAMTLEEWVDSQVSEAPHLFEPNSGQRAPANPPPGPHVGSLPAKNPFKRETWNLTEQTLLQKSDPELASRLKSAA